MKRHVLQPHVVMVRHRVDQTHQRPCLVIVVPQLLVILRNFDLVLIILHLTIVNSLLNYENLLFEGFENRV
jgi:hypothetical protein